MIYHLTDFEAFKVVVHQLLNYVESAFVILDKAVTV